MTDENGFSLLRPSAAPFSPSPTNHPSTPGRMEPIRDARNVFGLAREKLFPPQKPFSASLLLSPAGVPVGTIVHHPIVHPSMTILQQTEAHRAQASRARQTALNMNTHEAQHLNQQAMLLNRQSAQQQNTFQQTYSGQQYPGQAKQVLYASNTLMQGAAKTPTFLPGQQHAQQFGNGAVYGPPGSVPLIIGHEHPSQLHLSRVLPAQYKNQQMGYGQSHPQQMPGQGSMTPLQVGGQMPMQANALNTVYGHINQAQAGQGGFYVGHANHPYSHNLNHGLGEHPGFNTLAPQSSESRVQYATIGLPPDCKGKSPAINPYTPLGSLATRVPSRGQGTRTASFTPLAPEFTPRSAQGHTLLSTLTPDTISATRQAHWKPQLAEQSKTSERCQGAGGDDPTSLYNTKRPRLVSSSPVHEPAFEYETDFDLTGNWVTKHRSERTPSPELARRRILSLTNEEIDVQGLWDARSAALKLERLLDEVRVNARVRHTDAGPASHGAAGRPSGSRRNTGGAGGRASQNSYVGGGNYNSFGAPTYPLGPPCTGSIHSGNSGGVSPGQKYRIGPEGVTSSEIDQVRDLLIAGGARRLADPPRSGSEYQQSINEEHGDGDDQANNAGGGYDGPTYGVSEFYQANANPYIGLVQIPYPQMPMEPPQFACDGKVPDNMKTIRFPRQRSLSTSTFEGLELFGGQDMWDPSIPVPGDKSVAPFTPSTPAFQPAGSFYYPITPRRRSTALQGPRQLIIDCTWKSQEAILLDQNTSIQKEGYHRGFNQSPAWPRTPGELAGVKADNLMRKADLLQHAIQEKVMEQGMTRMRVMSQAGLLYGHILDGRTETGQGEALLGDGSPRLATGGAPRSAEMSGDKCVSDQNLRHLSEWDAESEHRWREIQTRLLGHAAPPSIPESEWFTFHLTSEGRPSRFYPQVLDKYAPPQQIRHGQLPLYQQPAMVRLQTPGIMGLLVQSELVYDRANPEGRVKKLSECVPLNKPWDMVVGLPQPQRGSRRSGYAVAPLLRKPF